MTFQNLNMLCRPIMCNVILRIARNLLETKDNIKIESHPFYHIICDWFSNGWSRKKKSKWPTQKTEIFKTINSQYFFAKFSVIGPSHHSILLTQGPIPENFVKIFWELTVLKISFVLSQPFWIFILLHPHENQSQIMW